MQPDLPLPAPAPSGSIAINARCLLRAEGEQRVVLVAGLPVHHYRVDDAVAEAYAMVLVVDGAYATQQEVAVAFGCSARTGTTTSGPVCGRRDDRARHARRVASRPPSRSDQARARHRAPQKQESPRALERRLGHYVRPHLLVVDELGYLSYDDHAADLLFQLVTRRYEHRALVLTTNLRFADWNTVFPNATSALS